jgi:hypothetical protein
MPPLIDRAVAVECRPFAGQHLIGIIPIRENP